MISSYEPFKTHATYCADGSFGMLDASPIPTWRNRRKRGSLFLVLQPLQREVESLGNFQASQDT